MVILGVDPGLKATGAVITEKNKSSFKVKYMNEIITDANKPLEDRVNFIFSSLKNLVDEFKPSVLVLEKIYSHYRHPTTSSLLGHVRGVIMLLGAQNKLKIIEYPATQIKKAVTSYGSASKEQVQKMVSYLAGLDKVIDSQHVADALALVLTYLHTQR